jgi:acyl transferase domain-containing protein/acyl carrier protein
MDKHALVAWLTSEVSRVTGIADVEIDQPLTAFGIDSAAVAALSAKLADTLGRPIETTLLFEHPTIESLAEVLSGASTEVRQGPARAALASRDIAIVGMSCRMPGAPDKDSFWGNLLGGIDGVRAPDPARVRLGADPTTLPGRGELPAEAGLLDDIDAFDAGFFRISAAEAEFMDPQQRLLLEVAWEALEDAGHEPRSLRRRRVGVFIGISHADYAARLIGRGEGAAAFAGTGNALSVAANRLSYLYDLHGPSLAVDTACSSSLTALHLAVNSIIAGECEGALVGAANLLLDAELTGVLQKAGMLAPDARCKPFSAQANGYVRGEGCGVVFLRPLDDALATGDRIYAVIKGTAIGQDGRSNGLTAPNPAAQESVLREACSRAGIAPTQVTYVEAHGTGTSLGDPIEIEALGRVFGSGRSEDQPLLVGSVKSNIGHLEAAAGMAGLIKSALAVHAGVIPGNLHYETPSPRIDFAGAKVRVVDAVTAWPAPDDERFCGVSSFGFGGANAHAVLAAPPPSKSPRSAASPTPELVLISAHTEAALKATARRWATWLGSTAGANASIRNIAHTAERREVMSVRAAVVADSASDLRRQLLEIANTSGASAPSGQRPRTILVFPGQGDHWATGNWARFASDRLFWSVIKRCGEVLHAEGETWSLEDALRHNDPALFAAAERAQPAILALQTAMVTVLKAHGLQADAVLGHSVGEIGAAVAAGGLSLEQGCRLALQRGRAMAAQSGGGATLAVDMGEAEALALVAERTDLDVAAVNGPKAITLAGPSAELARLEAELRAQGRRTHWVSHDFAFHSRSMKPAAAALREVLDGLAPTQDGVAFHSTVSGGRIGLGQLDADYWARNLCEPVRFKDAVDSVSPASHDVVIEVASRQVLRSAVRESSGLANGPVTLVAVGEAEDAGRAQLGVISRLYSAGLPVRRRPSIGARPSLAELPPRAWDHRRYWADAAPSRVISPAEAELLIAAPESKLMAWQRVIGGVGEAALKEHQVSGRAIVPATGHIGVVLTALSDATGLELRAGRILAPLFLDDGPVTTRLVAVGDPTGRRQVELYQFDPDASASTLASQFEASPLEDAAAPPTLDESIVERLAQSWSESELYDALAQRGLSYGPSFRLAHEVRAGEGEALGRIRRPLDDQFERDALDPRILDSALHLLLPAITSSAAPRGGGVPIGFQRLQFRRRPQGDITAHASIGSENGAPLGAVRLFDEGGLFASLEGVAFAPIATPQAARDETTNLFVYRTGWTPSASEPSTAGEGRSIILFADDQPLAIGLRERLLALGHRCTLLGSDALGQSEANPVRREGVLDAAVREVARQFDGKLDAVVSLWDLESSQQSDLSLRASRALDLIRAASMAPVVRPPLLILATSRTHMGQPLNPAGAVVWGLGKAVPFENPGLTCRCVDLADEEMTAQVAALADEIAHLDTEIEVAWRDGVRHVRRIFQERAPPPAPPSLRNDATYIVSGANGALGQHAVRWLAERGARHIVGIGRSATASAGLSEVAEVIASNGSVLEYLQADLGDTAALEAAWQKIAGRRQVSGVIHAAGVLRDGPMLNMSAAEVDEVLAPKADGLLNLRQVAAPGQLDFMLLFSSAAAVLGSPGQANYCAANAFLDAYAASARARGERVVSIGWGPWADGGMASGSAVVEQQGSGGLTAIPPPAGVEFLDRAFGTDAAYMAVVPFDLTNLIQYYPEGPGFQFFESLLAGATTVLRSSGRSSSVARRPDISALFVEPRSEAEHLIAGVWQRALGIDRVGVNDGFFELGGDSVLGNQILVEIGRRIGVPIDPADAFKAFTVAGLAALAEQQLIAEIEGMSEVEVLAEVG